MKRPCIELDFARSHRAGSPLGIALLATGMVCAALVAVDYRNVSAESDGLELRLADLGRDSSRPVLDKGATRDAEEARAALVELATPWSVLLHELELAVEDSQGSVAVLAVEPDREKHQVQV